MARVYCQGVEAIDGFEQSFAFPDDYPAPLSQGTKPSKLLRDCKSSAIGIIDEVASAVVQKRIPNAAVALRQGFLIGRWLAEAEAIISSVRAISMAAQTTGVGRPGSGFWEWLNSDPLFVGKSADEALDLLDGKDDPDHPNEKLRYEVKKTRLIRGNGDVLQKSSFVSKFKKRR